jgi:hypothetical protein
MMRQALRVVETLRAFFIASAADRMLFGYEEIPFMLPSGRPGEGT